MQRLVRALSLTIACLPAACAFLLDFDELQAGETGGQGGADAGCGPCETTDPCTPRVCEQGQCVDKPLVGLADDGLRASFHFPQAHRLTLTAFGNGFYGSVFHEDNGSRLRFFRIGVDEPASDGGPPASALTSDFAGALPALSGLATAAPASAAGMATQGSALIAAFGTSDGEVYGLRLSSDLTPQTGSGQFPTVGAEYLTADPQQHPAPWYSGGELYVGWVTDQRYVRVYKQNAAPPLDLGPPGSVQAFLPLLAKAGAAVLWIANGVFVQHEQQAQPVQLQECPQVQGWSYRAVSGFGLDLSTYVANIALWSKTDGASWALHSESIFCTAQACAPSSGPPTCGQGVDQVLEGAKNLASLAFQVPEQPAENYYEVDVARVEGGGQGQLLLYAGEINANTGAQTALGDQIALTAPEPAAEAADWPAVAFSGGDKLMVGWLDPDAGGDAVELRRFKLCLPR